MDSAHEPEDAPAREASAGEPRRLRVSLDTLDRILDLTGEIAVGRGGLREALERGGKERARRRGGAGGDERLQPGPSRREHGVFLYLSFEHPFRAAKAASGPTVASATP